AEPVKWIRHTTVSTATASIRNGRCFTRSRPFDDCTNRTSGWSHRPPSAFTRRGDCTGSAPPLRDIEQALQWAAGMRYLRDCSFASCKARAKHTVGEPYRFVSGTIMKRVGFAGASAVAAGLVFQSVAFARGVSPYLPLNLEPEIERKIERVLILGDQSVMSRPIAAATVLAALPKACKVDQQLCEQVQRYLARYTRSSGLTHASAEVAAAHGADVTLPDRYGVGSKSHWDASASAFWQPSDYILLDAGAVAYEGRTDFTGSMLSLGTSYAQLDIGYRPHWFSPLSDSSMLMSTEAPTMPSVTLSNYQPFTPLGLRYEIFDAQMSKSNHIAFDNPAGTSFTEKTGNPRLAGIHLSMEPMSGWSFGLNRLLQYGGAGRPSSLKDLFDAFFNPSKFDNAGTAGAAFNQQFGNQEGSVTSTLLFPGKVPFAFYVEYAGEDTSRGRSYL